MIICIEFDKEELTMYDAFNIIGKFEYAKPDLKTAVMTRGIVTYHSSKYSVDVTESPLVQKSYTIERVK